MVDVSIMKYANVLISGEKLVVCKHFLYQSPPQELVQLLIQLAISSYHMEEKTLESPAWSEGSSE